jgi:hypothetical protein
MTFRFLARSRSCFCPGIGIPIYFFSARAEPSRSSTGASTGKASDVDLANLGNRLGADKVLPPSPTLTAPLPFLGGLVVPKDRAGWLHIVRDGSGTLHFDGA